MKQDIGCLMALGLLVGALCIAYALAPTAVVLAGWTAAVVIPWWRWRKIDNPSPPPPEAPTENEKRLVRTIEADENNPHRHTVRWHKERGEA